jgi:hypothetical protein
MISGFISFSMSFSITVLMFEKELGTAVGATGCPGLIS